MDLIIKCPKCGATVDVSNEAAKLLPQLLDQERPKLAAEERHKAEAKAKQQLHTELERRRKEYDKESQAEMDKRIKVSVEEAQARIDRSYQEKLEKMALALKEERSRSVDAQATIQKLEAKYSQGSAQAQGIIAEHDLFQLLRTKMPADRCEVVKRGQGKKGTDVIIYAQRQGQRVGSLIVDDKWATEWGREWPEKVWSDMQMHNADFAYIAANRSALPEQTKLAGFGLAPCRRAGVRVWVIDRSNPDLVLAILMDGVEKLLKLAETKQVYGATSKDVEQFQAYLTKGYETDLREKAKHMSIAVRALNDLRKKVNSEYDRAMDALKGYYTSEARMHYGITSCFPTNPVGALPQIEFTKEQ